MDEVLLVSEVSKSYWRGGRPLDVLTDVSLRVRPGAIVAVVGERHEGKTTLLKIAAGIEARTATGLGVLAAAARRAAR